MRPSELTESNFDTITRKHWCIWQFFEVTIHFYFLLFDKKNCIIVCGILDAPEGKQK